MTRCGCFISGTGETCTLRTDHYGPHAFESERKCPRCWLRPVEVADEGLCWPCNSFMQDREDDEGQPRDWRLGKRVAVKYRTDSRFGTHGSVGDAKGEMLAIRLDTGAVIRDKADNWRTA